MDFAHPFRKAWGVGLSRAYAVKLKLSTCAEWMGGELHGAADAVAGGYSIDTRTLAAGELFFAVSGERYDAHAFVPAAIANGAVAAVVARGKLREAMEAGPCIAVDDPLMALQRLGAAVRQHWHGTLIGLTGSAGKTTTKEMVAAVLEAREGNGRPDGPGVIGPVLKSVLKSAGNLNNHFGVPLQLLRLEPEHAYAVIEMGMSNAGEIALLASLAKPDWGVVTNVGAAHTQNFADGIEGVALAKRELIDALSPETGVAFLNADDARVAAFALTFKGRSVLAGLQDKAQVRATAVEELGADGLRMQVWAGAESAELHLQLLGAHNASNALLALAVGVEAGVSLESGAAALATLTPGDKRGGLLHVRGALLIDDCYNSNPAALSAMIHTLMQLPAGRHIVIAGEMLELGDETGALHAACGEQAALAGADWVIGVQGAALALAEAAAKAGTPALFLHTAEEAGAWLGRELRAGDAVLLKGSRGVRLERALEGLG